MKQIVIVGGGQSGAYAASTLRSVGYDGRLTVLCEEEHAPYERPPLSKAFLLGEADSAALQVLPSEFWGDNDVDLILGASATRVVPGRGVLVESRELPADGVVLCTGAYARHLRVSNADLRGIHVLRTLVDAQDLRRRLLPGARLVVVGGGLIGSEIAASALALGCDVSVLDVAAVPLARALGAEVGARLLEEHVARGVQVVECGISRFVGTGSVTGVELTDGRILPADVVVVGVGASPRAELAVASGIEVDNGIVSDSDGRTSMPNVVVAGDVATVRSRGASRRVEHWKNAIDQGARAARTLLGLANPDVGPQWFWSEQHGNRVEAAGELDGERIVIRGEAASDAFSAWTLTGDGVLTGVVGFNAPRDVRAGMRWLAATPPRLDPAGLQDVGTSLDKVVVG